MKTPRPVPDRLDLLFGTRAIARFLTLSKGQTRRLIIPSFSLDGIDCALRSSIFDHLKTLEVDAVDREGRA